MNTLAAVKEAPWSWWRAALEGKAPVATTEPEQGYYRVRANGGRGQWEPVAIWHQEGVWWALRNGAVVRDVHALWTYCIIHPITHEAYKKAMAGGGFDDEPPLAAIGHNSGSDDPLEALRLEFLGWREQSDEILKAGIKTQADADRASILKDHFLKIRGKAQALFKAEKQPVVDEGKRIDEKYRALAHEKDSEPTAMIEALRRAMEGFLLVQKRAEEERQRAARKEAERLQREAEEAAWKVVEEKMRATAAEQEAARARANRLVEQAAAAEREAEERKVSAGRTGATTSLRKARVAKIVDYDACLMALKNHPDVMRLVETLAQRAVRSNVTLAGVEAVEVEKVI